MLIVISLFVICAIERAVRTQTISQCFSELKRIQNFTFLGEIWNTFTNWLVRTFCAEKTVDSNAVGQLLNTWKVLLFEDQCFVHKAFVKIDEPVKLTEVPDMPSIDLPDIKKPPPPPDNVSIYSADTGSVSTHDTELFDEPNEGQPPLPPQSTPINANQMNATSSVSSNTSAPPVPTAPVTLPLTTNVSIPPQIADNIPRVFGVGHCAINSIWYCFPRHTRPRQKQLLLEAYTLLRRYAATQGPNVMSYNDVDDYILRGVWQNECSAVIIELLAQHHKLNVNITGGVVPIQHRYGLPNDPVHVINFSGNHYQNSAQMQGGAIAKFDEMLMLLMPTVKDDQNIVELSAAPGYLINKLFDMCEDADLYPHFHAGVFTGKCAAKYTQKADGIKIEEYSSNFSNVFRGKKLDIIISDAARAVNTEALTSAAITYCQQRLNNGGAVMIKTFGDPHDIYHFATYFRGYLMHDGAGSERYLIAWGYKQDASGTIVKNAFHNFYDVYDKYHRDYTEHIFYVDHNKIKQYNNIFFVAPFNKWKLKLDNIPLSVSATALTGFASSSKTTQMIQDYPNAKFISPTKELSRKHQQAGVQSFTQHAIFGQTFENEVLVIDELSQFCVEYLYLLKIRFPSCRVFILGDVHQTEHVNYNSNQVFTSFLSGGVRNNRLDVYKIPQDITSVLNKKFGWHIRSHSDVQKSVYTISSKLDLLKLYKTPAPMHPKIIAYNNESIKKIQSEGMDASTITTYTGSRTENIVMVVDSAAIESNIINKNSVTYTALTRPTHRLFLYGDTQSIVKYYNFDATLISTYEDFNKIYFRPETFVKPEVIIPLIQTDRIAEDVADLPAVEQILDDLVKPSNPSYGTNRVIIDSDLPEIESGALKTNETVISAFPKDEETHNVSEFVCNIINQLSDNSKITLATLIKRYSRSYTDHSKSSETFAYTQLINGLCRALYDNDRCVSRLKRDMKCDDKELLKSAFDYVESLSEKLGENYATTNELLEIFDRDQDGKLSFFNKRQTKWKPEDGFDRTDKVGQGVASFSKRVNILFSAYARLMLDKVKTIIKDNDRSILLATHDSEAALNDQYMSLKDGKDDSNYTCNDFSEWDASFRKPFISLTSTLLRFMGMPEDMIHWFEDNRSNWQMIYRCAFGNTILSGSEKQFSGSPFTICENTICNMALCFSLFNYIRFQFAMFKGDDSAVACAKTVILPEARKILSYTQHGLKRHDSPIGEFAGWILTKWGLFPDVVRYSAKFIGKNYRDEEHFEEALMSLQERCSAVVNNKQQAVGCHSLSIMYSELTGNPISPEQCNVS